MDKVIKNNKVTLVGKIVGEFEFSHKMLGEGFYVVRLEVKRFSESTDTIQILISERLMDVHQDYPGQYVIVNGQYRSYNHHENGKNHLILSVFVQKIDFLDENDYKQSTLDNQIFLDGYICKKPIYRKTPLGREITDLLIAVNRSYSKADYLPCITWGRNARFASGFEIGSRISVFGRIQSREYTKKRNEMELERKVAYEISISRLELLEFPTSASAVDPA